MQNFHIVDQSPEFFRDERDFCRNVAILLSFSKLVTGNPNPHYLLTEYDAHDYGQYYFFDGPTWHHPSLNFDLTIYEQN